MKEINDKMDKELKDMIKKDNEGEAGDIYWKITGDEAIKKLHEYDDIDWQWSGEAEDKAKETVWKTVETEVWEEQQEHTMEERVTITYEEYEDTITH